MAVRLRVREVAKEKGIGMGKLQRMSDVAYNTVRRIFKDPYYITRVSLQYGKCGSRLRRDNMLHFERENRRTIPRLRASRSYR